MDETEEAAAAVKGLNKNNHGREQAERTANEYRARFPTQEVELVAGRYTKAGVTIYNLETRPKVFETVADADDEIQRLEEQYPNSVFVMTTVDGQLQLRRANADKRQRADVNDASAIYHKYIATAISQGFAGLRTEKKRRNKSYRFFQTPEGVPVPVRMSKISDMGRAIEDNDTSKTLDQLNFEGALSGLTEMIVRGWKLGNGKPIQDEQKLFIPQSWVKEAKENKKGITKEQFANRPAMKRTPQEIDSAAFTNSSSETIGFAASKRTRGTSKSIEFPEQPVVGPHRENTPARDKLSMADWQDYASEEIEAEINTPEYIDQLREFLEGLGYSTARAHQFLAENGLAKGDQTFVEVAGEAGTENLAANTSEEKEARESGPRLFDEQGEALVPSHLAAPRKNDKRVTKKSLADVADYERLLKQRSYAAKAEHRKEDDIAATVSERKRRAFVEGDIAQGVNLYIGSSEGRKLNNRRALTATRAIENTLKTMGVEDHPVHLIDITDQQASLQALGNGVMTAQDLKQAREHFRSGRKIKAATTQNVNGQIIYFAGSRIENFNKFMAVVAHELGHGVFKRISTDFMLDHHDTLLTEFTKEAHLAEQYKPSGTRDNGFEEWFSDKFAAWMIKRGAEAEKRTDGAGATRESKALTRLFNLLRIKLRKLFNTLEGRFRYNKPFAEFMDKAVAQKQFVRRNKDNTGVLKNFKEDTLAHSISKHIRPKEWAAVAKSYADMAMTELPKVVPFIFSADREMRAMGMERLADMWVQQSSTRSTFDKPSYMQGRDNARARWYRAWDKVEAALTDNGENPDRLKAAIAEMQAAAEKSDASRLSADARQLHEFLQDFHKDYLKPNIPTMGRLKVFFPRMFDLEAVARNRHELENIILQHYKEMENHPTEGFKYVGADSATVARIVDRILAAGGGFDTHIDDIEQAEGPGFEGRFSRILRDGTLNSALQQHGFLMKPDGEIITNYIAGATKRAEFERVFGEWKPLVAMSHNKFAEKLRTFIQDHGLDIRVKAGNPSAAINELADMGIITLTKSVNVAGKGQRADYVAEEIDRVPASGNPTDYEGVVLHFWSSSAKLREELDKAPDDRTRQRLKLIVEGYMGRVGLDSDPRAVQVMSWAMVYESWLTLLFSAVASIPDIAGPVLRARNFNDAYKVLSAQIKAIKGWKDAQERSRDLGLLNKRLTNMAIKEAYGQSLASSHAQKWMDRLFLINGQEKLTEFTRVLSHAGAEAFLESSAEKAKQGDARAKRYLSELNITAEQVDSWNKDGRPLWERGKAHQHEAVQNALYQFIDESVIRPNATQRPVWANHPMLMLVWHLKSFFYAYGKVVLGGMLREAKTRYRETGGGVARKMGEATVPLAIGGTMLLPLAALGLELREEIQYEEEDEPSNRYSGWEYAGELVSRAGIYGPFEIAFGAASRGDTDDSVASLLGPTYQHAHQLGGNFTTVATQEGYASDQALWAAIKRSTPVINQVPRLANLMKEQIGL